MYYPRIILLCITLLSLPLYAEPDNTQLAVWANEAIVATYTYNHQNFLSRQKEIAHYFTSAGWMAYSKALNDSKLPDVVQKNAYYVNAVATQPPNVKVLGNNQWQAVMPVLVVYKNPEFQQKQTLEVTLGFTSVPFGQGVRGLAITSLQAKVVQPACQCPTDNSADDNTGSGGVNGTTPKKSSQ